MKLVTCIIVPLFVALLCITAARSDNKHKRDATDTAFRITGPCPSGWTHFKSYCYFVSSAVKSWQAARTYCKSKGGDLVKIHSDEENEFVLNLVHKHAPSTKQVWIGLKWEAGLSKFIWADEALPKYTNWNRGQPSGKASEPCSNMWTGQRHGVNGYWNDFRCFVNRVFPCGLVCKRLP